MKKVITVDFDHTLAETQITAWGGSTLVPVQRVIDYVKQKHKEGCDLHVVTFRGEKEKPEAVNFIKRHKIPISSIICTDGKNKVPHLKKLNSKLHIDDSVEVCTLCIMAGIDVLLVDHGQEKFNTTAKSIPKI